MAAILALDEAYERIARDPSSFAREVRALPPSVRHVLVDEIQKVPALLDEVQALHDAAPGRWEFFLTGSSARRLRGGAAGRPGRKRLLSTPRFYLFDNGVRAAAAGTPFDPGVLETEGGHLIEHWVGTELLHRARTRGRGHGVSFWRTVTGAEVDFVWETPREDLPLEVKWTARPSPGDRQVETFLDTYPRRSPRGLVVCRSESRQRLTDRVVAIPWAEL